MIYNRPEYWLRKEEKPREAFLTFSSPNAFSISAPKNWDGVLEYSTNNTSWTEWDGSEISSASLNGEHILYLSGTGNTKITGDADYPYTWSITGTDIKCSGDIDTILDYATVEDGKRPAITEGCYAYMFQGCTGLTQAPDLPATTLAKYCYASMFQGCTGLTQAPALPATMLVDNCYDSMFYGCTGLTQAPALPATTLADYCYASMFRGCSKIKLSTTETGEYTQSYRIPTSGDGTTTTNSLSNMFAETGGTFTGTPSINTTYYLSNTNTIV